MKTIAGHLRRARWRAAARVVLPMLCGSLLAAAPSLGQVNVSVTVGMGSGAPGSSATVPITVTNTNGVVVTVGFDVTFDDTLLDGASTTCAIDPQEDGRSLTSFPSAGRVRFLLTDLSLRPIVEGQVATCTFAIRGATAIGTVVPLAIGNLDVDDNSVPSMRLPSTGTNGSIDVEAETPTPEATMSETNTPLPTATNTPVNTPPNTVPPTSTHTPVPPTVPPTSTRTAVPPTSTHVAATSTPTTGGGGAGVKGDEGCSLAASGATSDSAAWLMAPLALLLWRRRSH